MLKVTEVCKAYNKNQVLKEVSLSVETGEIHGLIGENSAGKTTLIKCVTGIYKADKGTILYDGEPVFDNPVVKEQIGYVADYSEYIPFCTVSKMVHMYEVFFSQFSKDKFNDLNQIFRIPVNRRVMTLSKGQKMRLAFMLEVAKQPSYLILDEPTSGLDPVAKAKFYEMLIQEVEQREIGVLISSHNLDGLECICDSVTMLHQGRVDRQMSMEEMKNELTRLQVVFEGGADKAVYEMPEILRISNVGSVYSMIVKGFDDAFIKKLNSLGATFVEPVGISLEELFVVLEESKEQGGEECQD